MLLNMLVHTTTRHDIQELSTTTDAHHRNVIGLEISKLSLLLIVSIYVVICGLVSSIPIETRRDILTTGLRELGFSAVESEGTYFLTTDLGPLSDYPDALTAARELPHRAGVVAIPLQVFCDHAGVGERSLRWAYCKRPEVLQHALDRLHTAFG